MHGDRAEIIRDLAAIVLAAVACPLAWFGGGFVGCATQGFNATCAMSGVVIAPPVLILAGLIAAALTRGLWGYAWVVLGVVVGMFLIFGIVLVGGTFLPVDPITGIIATLWFLAPVSLGYFFGRFLAWFVRAWRQAGPGDGGASGGASAGS
jgi:hypothetical protein